MLNRRKCEGTAGVFKSTSGWTDRKYYCLYNSASAGYHCKNYKPGQRKICLCKSARPDAGYKTEREDYLIVISNAAADELGPC